MPARWYASATCLLAPGAGVGVFVDIHQQAGVDFGIALRGRQGGMAEQFLNGPEVAATGQQVSRKAVTQ